MPKRNNRSKRIRRFKSFSYEEQQTEPRHLLKDESLEDSANLPHPYIIAAEIVEDLQAALSHFEEIAAELKK